MIQARAVAVLLTAGLLLPATAPPSPTSSLLSAPAPRPRPPRPLTRSDLVGVWRVTLGRGDQADQLPLSIALHRDGAYQRTDDEGGLREDGYWHLRADGSLLLFPVGPDGECDAPEVWALRGERRWHCERWGLTLHLAEKLR